MIKLINILKEITEDIYKDDSNTWTHVTSKVEVLSNIKREKAFIGINEDLDDFSYVINLKLSADKQNSTAPNFYKGGLYDGGSSKSKYLITFKAKESYPGDSFEATNWKEVDYPMIPNGNRVNRVSFQKSSKIGILKPEYRDIDNFKFYQYDPSTDNYVPLNLDKID
jgi:hypothetical protein